MIDAKILGLTPKSHFCPFCVKWHNWTGNSLQSYNFGNPYKYECNEKIFRLWFEADCIHIESNEFDEFCNELTNYNLNNGIYFKYAKENTSTTNQNLFEEEVVMKNNLFNNMEFGPNKDTNIASTLIGIAVKSDDNWRVYDKTKKEITDIGDMQLGNLPIFIVPTTKLTEGDLIKYDENYYYVIKNEAGSTQTLCAKTGEMKTIVPIKNVLGLSCYSKIVALTDSLNMNSDFDLEKLLLLSAISGQSGKNSFNMNQFLPFMLLKDKDGKEGDIKKMFLMSSMMSATSTENNPMNQFLPLMLLEDKDGKDDNMTKMVLMSSAMSNNTDTDNNTNLGKKIDNKKNKDKD